MGHRRPMRALLASLAGTSPVGDRGCRARPRRHAVRLGPTADRSRALAPACAGRARRAAGRARPTLRRSTGGWRPHGLSLGAPVFMRVFKREFELELWMKRDDRFHRFAVYPICRWSGRLGPKLAEGDAQAPEGFYTVDAKALNPTSRWHRSFNLGFPNAYDRSHQRTGSLPDGARRMQLDRLLRHDRCRRRRDLAPGHGRARRASRASTCMFSRSA